MSFCVSLCLDRHSLVHMEREGKTEWGKHTESCKCNAICSRSNIGNADCECNNEDGSSSREVPKGDAPSVRFRRAQPPRWMFQRGVVLRDDREEQGGNRAHDEGNSYPICHRIRKKSLCDDISGSNGEEGAEEDAPHDYFRGMRTLPHAHEEASDNAGEDAEACDHEGEEERCLGSDGGPPEKHCSEERGDETQKEHRSFFRWSALRVPEYEECPGNSSAQSNQWFDRSIPGFPRIHILYVENCCE